MLTPQSPVPQVCVPRALRPQGPAPALQPARWAPPGQRGPFWSEARQGGARPRCPRPRRVCARSWRTFPSSSLSSSPRLESLPGLFSDTGPGQHQARGRGAGGWLVGGALRRGPRGPRDEGCALASPRRSAPPPPALMGGRGARRGGAGRIGPAAESGTVSSHAG